MAFKKRERLAIFFEMSRNQMHDCGIAVREIAGQTIFHITETTGQLSGQSCFFIGPAGADPSDGSQWTEFREVID